MSTNDQADGFYDDGRYQCPKCIGLAECACTLHAEHFGRGNIPREEPDVYSLTHGRIPFRLTKGFNLLLRSER